MCKIINNETKKCLVTGDEISELIFNYEKPPEGEIKLNSLDQVGYKRQIWKFTPSNHFVSQHNMDLQNIYEGEYLEATYENEKKMSEIFEKIIYLPDDESDNVGRFKSIQNFSKNWFVNSDMN